MADLKEWITSYLAGPELVRQAVAGMTPEQLRARPIAGKWSTAEVVFHLADFEPVFVDRMKRAIALNKPLISGADENEFVKALAYDQRDVSEEVELIALTRQSFGRVLQALPPEAFQRQAVHTEKGLVSVEQMLKSATNHILSHLPFVQEKRKALGLS